MFGMVIAIWYTVLRFYLLFLFGDLIMLDLQNGIFSGVNLNLDVTIMVGKSDIDKTCADELFMKTDEHKSHLEKLAFAMGEHNDIDSAMEFMEFLIAYPKQNGTSRKRVVSSIDEWNKIFAIVESMDRWNGFCLMNIRHDMNKIVNNGLQSRLEYIAKIGNPKSEKLSKSEKSELQNTGSALQKLASERGITVVELLTELGNK